MISPEGKRKKKNTIMKYLTKKLASICIAGKYKSQDRALDGLNAASGEEVGRTSNGANEEGGGSEKPGPVDVGKSGVPMTQEGISPVMKGDRVQADIDPSEIISQPISKAETRQEEEQGNPASEQNGRGKKKFRCLNSPRKPLTSEEPANGTISKRIPLTAEWAIVAIAVETSHPELLRDISVIATKRVINSQLIDVSNEELTPGMIRRTYDVYQTLSTFLASGRHKHHFVERIEVVINEGLYDVWRETREKFRGTEGKSVTEKLLFHGTPEINVVPLRRHPDLG